MSQPQVLRELPQQAAAQAPAGIELRHLRYFVTLADAGTFTRAAELMYIAQPTLSQQIRRLEEFVGTQLLRREREGVRLTTAGTVLLETSRDVLALVDHGVSRVRQAAGLGRPRLRVVVPPRLPDRLVVPAASELRSAAQAADVDIAWMEAPLDAQFSMIREHQADAGVGWLTAGPGDLPAALDAMSLAEYEPAAWVPAWHCAARRGTVSLEELAGMDVIHGPRRAEPATYDAWTGVLRSVSGRFAFTDPPFRSSLPVALALAATARPPAAVLTGPCTRSGTGTWPDLVHGQAPWPPAGESAEDSIAGDMVRVAITGRPLAATAALVWSGDLPAPLQQVLFDAAEAIGCQDASPYQCVS